jgi:adenosine kinase
MEGSESTSQVEQKTELILLGLENPLLDISVDLYNEDLITKYNLQKGLACLASPEQMPLYDDIWTMEGKKTFPGGSTLNTIRAANFMLKDKFAKQCAFLGCIGKDEYGRVLE